MKRINGFLAFVIVLLTMPLGHAGMILMEHLFGNEWVYHAAIMLGLVGLFLLVAGIIIRKEPNSTFFGLFAGLFVWTGWIEYAFVYYAQRFEVAPLTHNGEVITKPEYLIMPASIGFWAVMMVFYLFQSKTGCVFFNWIQRKTGIQQQYVQPLSRRNAALSTFMEMIFILWTFYLLLLFVYDEAFFGDRHPLTYFVAFGSLIWSGILFIKLLKINNMAYAIRYAIPTVVIFWNFVEVLGRWDLFHEIWIEPTIYQFELISILLIFIALVVVGWYHHYRARIVVR